MADARRDESIARAWEIAAGDGRRAIEIVRERAAGWSLKPDRIGMIGLSAGAFLTTDVALDPRAAPIYGGEAQSCAGRRAATVHRGRTGRSTVFPSGRGPLCRLVQCDGPAELHIFTRGGHAFGVGTRGLPVDHWTDLLGNWLAGQEGGA